MSGRILLGALLLASATTPLVAGEAKEPQEPHVIAPAGGWQVDFDENRCRAGRVFGTGKDRTLLLIEQMSPGRGMPWTIAGGAVANLGNAAPKTDIRFGPEFPVRTELNTVKMTHGDFGSALRGRFEQASGTPGLPVRTDSYWGSLVPAEGDRVEWIELSRPGRTPQRLATGKLGDVYKVMNACIDDLVSSWGIDPADSQRMAKNSSPINLESVAVRVREHYPSNPLGDLNQADLFIRVNVSEEGSVSECKVVNMTKADEFDDRPCEMFRRYARFNPAIDRDGKPMKSFFTTMVAYRASE